MTRFFMTIPEASSLVVQAGAIGGRGQVYVLDMGKPVKILDLARQMIELSGRTEEQVPIAFVGARAGEKLHEELWNEGEAVGPTSHPKIMRAARPTVDSEWLDDELAELERLVSEGDTLGVTARLRKMVWRRHAASASGRARRHSFTDGPASAEGTPRACLHIVVTDPCVFCDEVSPSPAEAAGTVTRWTYSTV